MLLIINVIICYHYSKYRKEYCCTNNAKMENNELKKLGIKNRTCYYFADIIKF